MLLKDFYKLILLKNIDTQKHQVSIVIHKNHEIFKGHFPGNTRNSRACMLQIIKETAEEITNQTLNLQKLINVKFLTLMNPKVNSNLVLDFDITTTEEDMIK